MRKRWIKSLALAISAAIPGITAAATQSTWDGSAANWSDAIHWSTAPDYPNNTPTITYDAIIPAGQLIVDRPITIDNLTFNGGSIRADHDLSVLNATTWAGGPFLGTARLQFNDLTLSGPGYLIDGPTLDVAGVLQLTREGTDTTRFEVRTGTLNAQGTTNVTANATFSGVFNNSGTVNILAGLLHLRALTGANQGSIGTSSGRFIGSPNTFISIGSIGGTHTFSVSSLVNVPVVHTLGGAGIFHGAVQAATRVDVDGGSFTFEPGSTLATPLLRIMTTGTVTFNTDMTLSGLDMRSGTLTGSGDVTFTGAATEWYGGAMTGTGKTIFQGNHSNRNISGSWSVRRNIDFTGGTFDWRAVGTMTVRDGATLSIKPDGALSTSGSFIINTQPGTTAFMNNAGTLRHTGGSTAIVIPFTNSGRVEATGGLLRFLGGYRQTAGVTDLRNLTFHNPPPELITGNLIIEGGLVTGTTTIDAPVINSGTISPGSPIADIRILDKLTLRDASVLLLEIGGTSRGVSYDSISADSLEMGGILDVRLVNGFQNTISRTSSFDILTGAAAGIGAFNNVQNGRVATSDGFGSFRFRNNFGTITLSDYQPVPEPSAVTAMFLACAFLIRRSRTLQHT